MSAESLNIADKAWDAIIVGTGIGGATIGHALAGAGWRVLFIEKGQSQDNSSEILTGAWAEETYFANPTAGTLGETLRRSGRWVRAIGNVAAKGDADFVPVLGEISGGSSALYGMVMERFFDEDIASSLWPIKAAELAPYYSRAENLYHVRGTRDPLRDPAEERGIAAPPPFSPANAELVSHLTGLGMHPYSLPMACDYVPGCRECIGFLCPRGCKADGNRICVRPAVAQFGATLLDRCAVTRLVADKTRVTEVECRREGREIRLSAPVVILAAGALQTPELLLRSASEAWPTGLANRSDQVGRNLMRHLLDYYIVQTRTPPAPGDLVKQVAFNDLYRYNGVALGTVQSNGRLPPAHMVARGHVGDLVARWPWLGPIAGVLRPIVQWRIKQLLRSSLVLAAILEDRPYPGNRVVLRHDGSLAISYSLHADERKRLAQFRRAISKLFARCRVTPIYSGERYKMLGHACGTCRMGEDPASSVLDRNNKAHGIDNLYVVDSSFLPTSTGTNPSLTLAANALRVAHHLIGSTPR